jgi:hypothetical protein
MFGFHTIKAVLALLGADWGCQTARQARLKGQRWEERLAHVGIVAGVQALSAATADTSWAKRLLFVAINAATHFLIDSVPMPKALDQTLHVAVAVGTAPLLRSKGVGHG